MKEYKKVPKFDSEIEEKKFWQTHDSDEYIDWSTAQLVQFPRLKKHQQ